MRFTARWLNLYNTECDENDLSHWKSPHPPYLDLIPLIGAVPPPSKAMHCIHITCRWKKLLWRWSEEPPQRCFHISKTFINILSISPRCKNKIAQSQCSHGNNVNNVNMLIFSRCNVYYILHVSSAQHQLVHTLQLKKLYSWCSHQLIIDCWPDDDAKGKIKISRGTLKKGPTTTQKGFSVVLPWGRAKEPYFKSAPLFLWIFTSKWHIIDL